MPPSVLELRALRERALGGAAPDRIEAQKSKGKLLARERIDHLLDDGTFQESGLFVKTSCHDFDLQQASALGDGVVTGFGKIDGRTVAVFAQDFTVLGGSLGFAHSRKIARLMDEAIRSRAPIIGLLDSGGARIQEGVDSLDGYAAIFQANVKASGVVPQLSVILGPCAGGAVYSPALTDFVFMVDGLSQMFITGPQVVKATLGQEVDLETLGGAKVHSGRSGVCHFLAASEQDCLRQVRELLACLPSNRWQRPPMWPTTDGPERPSPFFQEVCALDGRKPYDIHDGIRELADDGGFLEVHKGWAKNLVAGFIRLGGHTVGVVANNPAHLAGALDIEASEKAARFVRFLDNFNIPVLTLVDVPGYWPGLEQEHGGIIRRGAKLLYAYAEATVPKVTVVLRKAFGGAYIAMGSKLMGADFNLALPSAEIGVMGASGAVEILFGKQIKTAADPEGQRRRLMAEYVQRFASPYQAAASGSVDEVVEPKALRSTVIRCLEVLRDKRRPGEDGARGNLPL
ncbi:MAG: acyl-CoA carboxylase subunit beta [Elusimicrobia bacterium]|nr:acyl-CoA carboxylase subunit beta [Elusimicrobiota bacterium]